MKARDERYIIDRLYDPADRAMEALERLKEADSPVLSSELLKAIQEFKDKCREIARRIA